jgi:hypothetical protein
MTFSSVRYGITRTVNARPSRATACFSLKISLAGDHGRVLAIREDPRRELGDRCDDIGEPRVDRAARHAVELRRLRRLHERRARCLLDRAQPQRAIAAHPAQDHADAALSLILRERAEEEVDRQHAAAARRLR